jgi:hypothetical protein
VKKRRNPCGQAVNSLQKPRFCVILASLTEFGITVFEIHACEMAKPCDLSVRSTAKIVRPQKNSIISAIPISNAHVMKRAKKRNCDDSFFVVGLSRFQHIGFYRYLPRLPSVNFVNARHSPTSSCGPCTEYFGSP